MNNNFPAIVNAISFKGPNEKKLKEIFILSAAINCEAYSVEEDGLLVFSTFNVLSLKKLLKVSSEYPQDYFFWSWCSEDTSANAYFRIKNGEIIKKKIRIPR